MVTGFNDVKTIDVTDPQILDETASGFGCGYEGAHFEFAVTGTEMEL